MRRTSEALLALTDQIVAAVREPAETREVARRVGTVPCHCLVDGHPGRWSSGAPCTTCRDREGAVEGWRLAGNHDVYPILVRLERAGIVAGDRVGRTIVWKLAVRVRPIDVDLELVGDDDHHD
jgi:hypothetical protein